MVIAMDKKRIILKILGIIVGIIAGCVLLAILVGAPIMRNMQYNNAMTNAENGYYEAALQELDGRNMDEYKDVKVKKQEYAIEAAKQYTEKEDYEKAYALLNYAVELEADSDLTKEAEKLLADIRTQVPYID